MKSRPGVIPGSDGAGIVTKVGHNVTALTAGDKVVTHLVPETFKDSSLGLLNHSALPHMGHICAGLGQELDGTLTTHGVFQESCLVKFGGNLSFEEATTLSCSGITAWNSLNGLQGREIKKGDWVLVQGSGGVSVAALQFAVATGATVVATTSGAEKGERLRELGASHIINYREIPEWGPAAKELTPSKGGFDIVVDVAGNATLAQSINAVRINGLVVIAGMVGKTSEQVPLMSVLPANCIVRGITLGTRQMMRDMVAFVEQHNVRPALDTRLFRLEESKEALERLEQQKHFSKVIVRIPGKQ